MQFDKNKDMIMMPTIKRCRFMKRVFLIGFVVMAIHVFAASAFAFSLGVADDYSAFIFGSFTSWNSDTEGRLAAGGNVALTSYGVGDGLSGTSSIDTLVVGGNLTFTNGQINNGDAVVGGTATLTGVNVKDGTLTQNTDVSIDFAAAESYLTNLSDTLASITANGTVKSQWGTMTLTGDGTSSLQVFSIDASQLSGLYTITIAAIPAGATVVINVSGESVSLSNLGMSALASIASNVLFNFYEATSLTLSSVGIQGSILATSAAVTANNGSIDGTVIAASWIGTMEIHNVSFESTTSVLVPEPGTLVLFFSGLIGLAGLKRRLKK